MIAALVASSLVFLAGFAAGVVLGFAIVKWMLFGLIREGSIKLGADGELELREP